jgi:hypothetical protein
MTTMPDVNLELADAAELAELLTFLTDWLSGSQQQTLTDSLTAFIGHPACDVETSPPTYTASSSCSASTTANNSSENPHHDQQWRWPAPRT